MTRNKPLRSKTPLNRKTRLKQRRSKPRRSGRVRDMYYLLAVKGLPCWFATPKLVGITIWNHGTPHAKAVEEWFRFPCQGSVEADHAGHRPLGRKADDSTAIPLCRRHHQYRTDYKGWFWGWNKTQMREWCDARIAETRAQFGWKEAA